MVAQAGGKVLLFWFARHLHPFCLGAGGWHQHARTHTHTYTSRGHGCVVSWAAGSVWLGNNPLPFYRQVVFQPDQPHHLLQCVAAQTSAGTTEGRVQGWTWVVAEDPQLKAPCTPCMVLGACGGGVDTI